MPSRDQRHCVTPVDGAHPPPLTACGEPVPAGAPVDLCRRHLVQAMDFALATCGDPTPVGGPTPVGSSDVADVQAGAPWAGVEDTLASPCVLCGARLGVRYPSGVLCAVCEWRVGDVPAADLAPPRVDVVYYIRFSDRIKIGTSANPRLRLATLWHDELLALERGDRHVERRRHEQFGFHRLGRSEWFAVHPALDAHVDALRAGVDDPWRLHTRWLSEAGAAQAW